MVAEEFFEYRTTDFYPILTRVLPRNPDAIDFESASPGFVALLIKQATELGYQGVMWGDSSIALPYALATAGKGVLEGYLCMSPDFTSPLWPEASRELAADYFRRYPDLPLDPRYDKITGLVRPSN